MIERLLVCVHMYIYIQLTFVKTGRKMPSPTMTKMWLMEEKVEYHSVKYVFDSHSNRCLA